MIRGLYTASTGMNVQSKRMDLISNDLANVNTTGYKKDVAVAASFEEVLMYRMKDIENNVVNDEQIGSMTLGVRIDDVYTQFAQGSLVKTDSMTNLAIQGNGFFAVETPEGIRYTRDGNFSIDRNGDLVTKEGYMVLGEDGPIRLGQDFFTMNQGLEVRENGEVQVGNEVVNRIMIVEFEDPQMLVKQGDNLYQGAGQGMMSDSTIIQGFLEASNVNPVQAMVDMISVSRAYEASQKLVQVHDQLLGKVVNEVGKA